VLALALVGSAILPGLGILFLTNKFLGNSSNFGHDLKMRKNRCLSETETKVVHFPFMIQYVCHLEPCVSYYSMRQKKSAGREKTYDSLRSCSDLLDCHIKVKFHRLTLHETRIEEMVLN
jgi:hypothetical protein